MVRVPAPDRADPDTVAWNARSLGSNVRTRPAEAMLRSSGNDRIDPHHKIPGDDSQSSRQRGFRVRICVLVSMHDLTLAEKSLSDVHSRKRRSPWCHGAAGQGTDAGQAARPATDQQSQRHADDAGPGSEQFRDRDGHQGAAGSGRATRSHLRRDRRGQARPGAHTGAGGFRSADRRLLWCLVGDCLGGHSAGHRPSGQVRDVGQPQEPQGRADGGGRARLERREDQANGGRRRQAAGPVRAHRTDLGRAPVPARRACLQ